MYHENMMHIAIPYWLKLLVIVILLACLGAVGYTLVTGNKVINVVFPGGPNPNNPEVKEFNQLKETYSGKRWQGKLKWTSTASIIQGSLSKESGTVTIKEMWINFDAPYSDSFYMLYAGGPRISVDGKATVDSYTNTIDSGRVVPQVSYPIPFTLDGTIDFKEKTIYFHVADPDSDKTFTTLYFTPDGESIEGDDTSLSDYFHVPDANYVIENGKMTINGELSKDGTKLTVNGVLEPL